MVSNFHFVGDKVIMGEKYWTNIIAIKVNMLLFELLLGLKVV